MELGSQAKTMFRANSRRGLSVMVVGIFLLSLATSRTFGGSLEEIRKRGVLLWGGDAEGGAPYSFPDPDNPERLIGYEVEIADELARRLGVQARMVQAPWSTLPQALARGDIDIILNGLEITPERRRFIAFSDPYYRFSLALTVSEDDAETRSLQDLVGKRVGTLKGTLAQRTLEGIPGAEMRLYEDNVSPYRDIGFGRLDAVLMDFPIARYYGEQIPGLKYADPAIGEGYYAAGIRLEDEDLLEEINRLLNEMRRDGSLGTILRKWGLQGGEEVQFEPSQQPITTYLPLLLKGTGLTIVLSCTSMLLAVLFGWLICLGRLFGPAPLSKILLAYIEVFRGTPLLLQLLVIYFGFPAFGLTLPAWAAGILGLSLNYAAYEAEIFRGGMISVPKGQTEAALSLGMTQPMTLRFVVIPQALRVSLPASTNDFIALFKDSSLCSVIGVVELTKEFNILAISTWRVAELGLLTAILYLALSYPLSVLARRLEKKVSKGRHSW